MRFNQVSSERFSQSVRHIVLAIPVFVGTSEVEVPGEKICPMQRQFIPIEINAPLIKNYFFLMLH